MNEKPEQILSRLFLSMFSSDELRRLIRYSFPDELSQVLPGASVSAAAVAEAVSVALLQRDDLAELWPRLLAERPRRKHEIEAARDRIVASGQRLGGEAPPGSERSSIRLLFVLSCPQTQEQLSTQEEVRQIRDELAAAPYGRLFEHEIIVATTYTHLRKALRQYKPHILHFACHGTPEAELILDDGHGYEERVEAATIVDLLEVLKEDLRLVVLNACDSTSIARKLAPQVGLVVGMGGAVTDCSAVWFAQVFYESIAAGDTVERSFRLGVNELLRRKLDSNLPQLLPAEGEQRQYRFVRS